MRGSPVLGAAFATGGGLWQVGLFELKALLDVRRERADGIGDGALEVLALVLSTRATMHGRTVRDPDGGAARWQPGLRRIEAIRSQDDCREDGRAAELGEGADAAMNETFGELAEAHDEDPVMNIESREIRAKRRAGGVIWFDFQTLCGGPRSQNDYLEIASQFHTLMLSGVPQMAVRQASEARRFTWLIDVLYDRRVKLVMSAEVPPEQLYTDGPMAHEFPRTVSRLGEMQSAEYLALAHRTVDTGLT